jgi:Cation transporting ATPase, C-terminus
VRQERGGNAHIVDADEAAGRSLPLCFVEELVELWDAEAARVANGPGEMACTRMLSGRVRRPSGSHRYAQTMAFTTLVLFQLFNVLNARSDEQSAFNGVFGERMAVDGGHLVAAATSRCRVRAFPPGGVLDHKPQRG